MEETDEPAAASNRIHVWRQARIATAQPVGDPACEPEDVIVGEKEACQPVLGDQPQLFPQPLFRLPLDVRRLAAIFPAKRLAAEHLETADLGHSRGDWLMREGVTQIAIQVEATALGDPAGHAKRRWIGERGAAISAADLR
ncbi:MAG: hypothetical protein KatS3mg060_3076 [Dehalococcoidia bacterium]|nr:MAG: hypothetical protein KatS3mg060_3076 [Dehalococcoidia bacterium]